MRKQSTKRERLLLHGWIRNVCCQISNQLKRCSPSFVISVITVFYIDTWIQPIINVSELIKDGVIRFNQRYRCDTQFRISNWNTKITFQICCNMKKLGSIIIYPTNMNFEFVPVNPLYLQRESDCKDKVYRNVSIRSPDQGETLRFVIKTYVSDEKNGFLIISFSTITPRLQCGIGYIKMIIPNMHKTTIFAEWKGHTRADMVFSHVWDEPSKYFDEC